MCLCDVWYYVVLRYINLLLLTLFNVSQVTLCNDLLPANLTCLPSCLPSCQPFRLPLRLPALPTFLTFLTYKLHRPHRDSNYVPLASRPDTLPTALPAHGIISREIILKCSRNPYAQKNSIKVAKRVCRDAGLNHGHSHLQCHALPTELSRLNNLLYLVTFIYNMHWKLAHFLQNSQFLSIFLLMIVGHRLLRCKVHLQLTYSNLCVRY